MHATKKVGSSILSFNLNVNAFRVSALGRKPLVHVRFLNFSKNVGNVMGGQNGDLYVFSFPDISERERATITKYKSHLHIAV